MLEFDAVKTWPGFRLDARVRTEESGITALYGPSGSGKTTLVNILAGLEEPDRGRVALAGTVVFDSDAGINVPPERRRIGYVFQDGRLFPHFSVRANMLYGKRRDGGLTLERVVSLLDIAPLLDRRPHALSGGEKQRVAIGRALLADPALLLMDEPLASLDTRRKAEILPFVRTLQGETGIPVVYVSHVMDEIVEIADALVLMDRGAVVASGPVEDLLSRLDLREQTGRHGPGAAIHATVEGHDGAHGLTRLSFGSGAILVPEIDQPLGSTVRIRIRAADVALALERPRDISTLNILEGTIRELSPAEGAQVDVLVDAGLLLWAQVTPLAVERLKLAPGVRVYALIKAVAIGGPPPQEASPANHHGIPRQT